MTKQAERLGAVTPRAQNRAARPARCNRKGKMNLLEAPTLRHSRGKHEHAGSHQHRLAPIGRAATSSYFCTQRMGAGYCPTSSSTVNSVTPTESQIKCQPRKKRPHSYGWVPNDRIPGMQEMGRFRFRHRQRSVQWLFLSIGRMVSIGLDDIGFI